jgi:hypothetical protein
MVGRMNYDDNFYAVQLFAPTNMTGAYSATTAAGIDVKGCANGVLLVDIAHMATGASLTFELMHCDSLTGTYADVCSHIDYVAATDADDVNTTDVKDVRRYLKLRTSNKGEYAHFGVAFIGWNIANHPV